MSIHLVKGWIMNTEQVNNILPGWKEGLNDEYAGISILEIKKEHLGLHSYDKRVPWYCVGWVYASLIGDSPLERKLHVKIRGDTQSLEKLKEMHGLSTYYEYSIDR